MPTIPCPNKVTCPCPDDPLFNLSSEAPDIPVFRVTGYAKPTPPLGTAFNQLSCDIVAVSTLSEADAQLLAELEAQLCATASWTNAVNGPAGSPSGPVPPPQANQGGRPFAKFFNQEQRAAIPCPEGSDFVYVVPANKFTGRTQQAANQAALTYGQHQAQIHRLCVSDIPDTVCANTFYSAHIFASGQFVGPTNFWQISSGLPDGLTFNGGNIAGPASIAGTPTTPGLYNFVVSVTVPNGDTNDNEYFFQVAGLTNGGSLPDATIGVAYLAQLTASGFNNPIFTISDEPLPDGLQLNPDGSITGTPSGTAVSGSFTLFIRDAVTGLECSASASITVKATINFNELAWGPPYGDPDPTHYIYSPDTSPPNQNNLTIVYSGAFNSTAAGSQGAMTYTGPAVAGNLHVQIIGNPTDNEGVGNHIDFYQDGNFLFFISINSLAVGSYDFPFTYPASAASLIQINVNFAQGPGLPTTVIWTFTPAF